MNVRVQRVAQVLKPDAGRVLLRPFRITDDSRIARILGRLMALSEERVETLLACVFERFSSRHADVREFLSEQYERVRGALFTDAEISETRKLLIGAHFSQEYALEAAALFNPSMVPHPDQSKTPEGALRYILSLRSTGEGHISSISFRTGTIAADGSLSFDPPGQYVRAGRTRACDAYEKRLFRRKLQELGMLHPIAEQVLAALGDAFGFRELAVAVERACRDAGIRAPEQSRETRGILLLARSNYEVRFATEAPLSEKVLFPHGPTEINGMEDARFVKFQQEDGTHIYYATYTAYDGRVAIPQILETRDFETFVMSTLNGPAVQNKGLALFPRKIRGLYAMLSRQDNENIFLMYSDMLHFWYEPKLIARPTFPWEFIQLGNCGSPIELPEGWLVLTHGVGPMREYSIGAMLLDREDPLRVIGRSREPLLTATGAERKGYVPNVVYSCGSLAHAGRLFLPYAMSDQVTGVAVLDLKELLATLA
ncbi:MAG: glycoside hydrolase family 130 protein [Verrucomicrobiae bacterium]|nr:glycoside hydrolase family 130 protein [Verrucomicrobiae bacterium]